MPKNIFTQELEGTRWKEEVERDLQVLGVRRWRELVADRKKREGHFSTGQSPQWAVVPMERVFYILNYAVITNSSCSYKKNTKLTLILKSSKFYSF